MVAAAAAVIVIIAWPSMLTNMNEIVVHAKINPHHSLCISHVYYAKKRDTNTIYHSNKAKKELKEIACNLKNHKIYNKHSLLLFY